MKPLWKQLLYLHGHALPATELRWREDAPATRGRRAPTAKPVAPMLRWRAVVRAALIG
ncbi:MAG TPA: hypothetical protein VGU65_01970 [Frateuria sp.]|uniref:hypothetical protein n=1 Tax=Frateuria sp. TaxID=2211372 RepID=UPI002DEF8B3D|nr:hypothetical protein [Frateuria sp.]